VLGTTTYRTEALNAQRTTRETVEVLLATSSSDFSLCHGLAGLADVLSVVGPVLDSSEEETRSLVQRVAERGVQWSSDAGMIWPCGTGAGETPGLMLGLAGIGSFYLRVANPSFPSVVVVGGEWSAATPHSR
jgi:lantibiotic biosynthesis protein